MKDPLIVTLVGIAGPLLTLAAQYLFGKRKSIRSTEKVEVDIVKEYRELQMEMESEYQKLRHSTNALYEENLNFKAQIADHKKA